MPGCSRPGSPRRPGRNLVAEPAEWVVTQFATAKIGAILVNVNPSYRSSELEYALNQSGCSALILAPGFKDADYVELVSSGQAPALRKRVRLGP